MRREFTAARHIPYGAHVALARHSHGVRRLFAGVSSRRRELREQRRRGAQQLARAPECAVAEHRGSRTWRCGRTSSAAARPWPICLETDGGSAGGVPPSPTDSQSRYREQVCAKRRSCSTSCTSPSCIGRLRGRRRACCRDCSRSPDSREMRAELADALDACEKLAQTLAASLARYEPELLGCYRHGGDPGVRPCSNISAC